MYDHFKKLYIEEEISSFTFKEVLQGLPSLVIVENNIGLKNQIEEEEVTYTI